MEVSNVSKGTKANKFTLGISQDLLARLRELNKLAKMTTIINQQLEFSLFVMKENPALFDKFMLENSK